MPNNEPSKKQSVIEGIPAEQLAYANVLDIGMKASLSLLIITFAVYMFNLRAPHVPVEKLPQYWTLPAKEMGKQIQVETGWLWVHQLGDGDYMNYVGMVFLAGVSALCYARVLPIFLKKKDYLFSLLVLLEIVAIVLAASGIFVIEGQ